MKNPELFNKTVAILVKAYLNDTLQHFNCCACAVGNIVAANMGLKLVKDGCGELEWDGRNTPSFRHGWASCFSTSYGNQTTNYDNYNIIFSAKEEIDSTGYSVEELAEIELVFERKRHTRAPIFSGLMSVVDVLIKIHEASETECAEAKQLFVKTPQLV